MQATLEGGYLKRCRHCRHPRRGVEVDISSGVGTVVKVNLSGGSPLPISGSRRIVDEPSKNADADPLKD